MKIQDLVAIATGPSRCIGKAICANPALKGYAVAIISPALGQPAVLSGVMERASTAHVSDSITGMAFTSVGCRRLRALAVART